MRTSASKARTLAAPVGRNIVGDAARHDRVHHQPVAEAGFRRAQRALAQDAALRVHQRERGVVADGADVAEMIGEPLELGHQRPQIERARRRLDLKRRLGGLREGKSIGHRAVAGGAPGELGGGIERRARHQGFDALVHIAEPLLQPHDVLAVGGEAEMAGLDDAGMHRADRNLVQALAVHRQELVRRGLCRRPAFAERMAHIPEAEIEPRPRIGRADRLQAEQIADRAFEPDRRRMARRHARIFAPVAGVADDGDFSGRLVEQRHVHVARVAPQAEQSASAGGEQFDRPRPAVVADKGARPRPVLFDRLAVRNVVEQGHGGYPSSRATFSKPVTSAGGR